MSEKRRQRLLHLVSDPANIRYLTGFNGAAPSEKEVYLGIIGKTKYLLTNSLYEERAKAISGSGSVKYVRISRTKRFDTALKQIAAANQVTEIRFESRSLTYEEYSRLRKTLPPAVTLTPDSGWLIKKRQLKSETEIGLIRQAAAVTDQICRMIPQMLKPGISEQEVARQLIDRIHGSGAGLAFSPIVAFGPHTSQPHYQTGTTKLGNNMLILVDFGAAVDGYASDLTRVFYHGSLPDKIRRAYEAVRLAKEKATLYLKQTQNPCGAQADRIAKNIIRTAGFPPYTHSLGHALGLQIHESPRLTVHKDRKIEPNMVFTIEPGTYLPGDFGIRLEDTVLKTADGLENLTNAPIDLIRV